MNSKLLASFSFGVVNSKVIFLKKTRMVVLDTLHWWHLFFGPLPLGSESLNCILFISIQILAAWRLNFKTSICLLSSLVSLKSVGLLLIVSFNLFISSSFSIFRIIESASSASFISKAATAASLLLLISFFRSSSSLRCTYICEAVPGLVELIPEFFSESQQQILSNLWSLKKRYYHTLPWGF